MISAYAAKKAIALIFLVVLTIFVIWFFNSVSNLYDKKMSNLNNQNSEIYMDRSPTLTTLSMDR